MMIRTLNCVGVFLDDTESLPTFLSLHFYRRPLVYVSSIFHFIFFFLRQCRHWQACLSVYYSM